MIAVLARPEASRVGVLRAENVLRKAIEIATGTFQHVGGVIDNHVHNSGQGARASGLQRLPGEIVLTILEGFHMLETDGQKQFLRQGETERRQCWQETLRPVDHGNAEMEPILLGAQPARRFYFGEGCERWHLESERALQKSDLPRVRPHGVDPVGLGRNSFGIRCHRYLSLGGGGMKAQHRTPRLVEALILDKRPLRLKPWRAGARSGGRSVQGSPVYRQRPRRS